MSTAPEYQLSNDLREVFLSLQQRITVDSQLDEFVEYANLDVDRFAFVVSSRAATEHRGMKNIAKIRNITEPVSLVTPIRYIIAVYDGAMDWTRLNENQKQLVLLHELMHVDLDHEFRHPDWDKQRAGRLVDHDLNDFRKLINKFGVNWLDAAK